MKTIKNILVCLDLTEIDASLITYAAFIADAFQAENVFFIHVIQAYDLPRKSSKSFPDLKTSLNNMIRSELNQQVDRHFHQTYSTDIIVRIEEEDAAEELISSVKETEADLLMLGQKHGEDRQARYGQKVAAQAPCDILFVPENHSLSLQKILCAIDFTQASSPAFDRALYLKEQREAELVCYFVHDLTKAYFPASTRKSADRSYSRAEKKYREFISGFDRDPKNFTCLIEAADERTSEAEKIYRAGETENANLIIVGAAGSTGSETSLLGNITESLRRMQKYIPVLIVKYRENKKLFLQILR